MNTDKTYAEQIAAEYAPKDTSKVVALRKLDRRAKLPANIAAYSIGILGMVGMGLNYPIYKHLLEQGKQKYAADIMRLASQISE